MTGNIVSEYYFHGEYEYGKESAFRGAMRGKGIRYGDGRFIGIMNDKDSTDPLFLGKGFSRYFLGGFHSLGLSIIKFDSFETTQPPIYWAFEKAGEGYTGGWQTLQFPPFVNILKSAPSLQAVVEIGWLSYLFRLDFNDILTHARKAGRIGSLRIRNAPSGTVCHSLGL